MKTRNLTRRIVGVHEERPGKLELTIERFGGIEGRVSLFDVDRAGPAAARRGPRLVFRMSSAGLWGGSSRVGAWWN